MIFGDNKLEEMNEQIFEQQIEIKKLKQELAKLTNKFEKAKRYIELCPCDPDIYPDQLKAWNEYQDVIKNERI